MAMKTDFSSTAGLRGCIIVLLAGLIISGTFSWALAEDTVVLTVRPGDNLVAICEKHLEDPRKWDEVARLNQIRNPHRIYPRMTIRIPVRLLRGVPIAAKVTFVKGHVTVRPRGTEGWVPLATGDHVGQGSRIKTGSQSAAELTYEDGSSVLLRDNTEIEVLRARRKSDSYRVQDLFVHLGQAIAKVRKMISREPRFRMHTPTSVTGVRGTEFRTSVDTSDASRFEVLAGTVGVAAMRTEVTVVQGEGTLVNKGKAPLPPRALLPPPEFTALKPLYKSLSAELRFGPVDGASSYRIMIARDPAFKDIVLEKRIQPDKALPILNIEDGSYYLRAESIDALGLIGIPSDTAQLNIRVNPLPPFVNSPEDGTEYKGTEVLFKWLKVSDAIRYHVQVAEDDAFETLVTDRDDVRANEYQISVPGFGTYSFRIRSMAHDGYKGAWSDILHFTTVPPPPRPPVEAPEVGEELIKIRWGDLGEGITYHFQMAKDEGFQELLLDQRLEKPEISFEKPEKPGTYYIRTSGIDATGYEGEFSMPPQSFEVEKGFPYELLGIIAGFAILIMM